MKNVLFEGCATALVTPFTKNGVDFKALKKLLLMQIEQKVSAIVILGTTGEPSTLTENEKIEIIKFARSLVHGNIKLIVGTGGNNTQKVIEWSKKVQKLGADGLLIVTPYYNKCTQKGLVDHYKKISNSVNIPIIVYNVPGRTGVNILPETMLKLSRFKNVVGIKEASGNINQVNKMFALLKNRVAIYSGEDELNYYFLCMGGKGVISVLSNIVPKQVVAMCKACKKFNFKRARNIHKKYYNLTKLLFIEVNPIPVKTALYLMKKIKENLRLPLCKMEEKNKQILMRELLKLKLVEE